ncbi:MULTISPECIES: DUF6056 family protein [Francisella]|uniref:Glycosyltransferase RgtA/B/C/D-like domain-containing protein n=1 Tax=Francisella opportunistica TaxID=2016517 RepID=A0A345JQJ3_9GAMM|nr:MULTISPECIES: DUF6056 family protein [Francisella]APC91294.1 hypothetical protein BBG19_0558 [Francisella sp. MA067296]AXH29589.1 hypothetical protein CGC43_02845 [Francisella opportunistica]AXH31240.1 hypothetical protein CGC44_02820 [Francisella opportunistica]AXH32887.1 hypothetical protein CGC45_02830 [Francisella opportunistica]
MKFTFRRTIFILSIFLFFLYLNIFQPMSGDDLLRFNMDVLYNQTMLHQLQLDYNSLTGRISAQILVYIFLNKGFPFLVYLFNFINSLIMTFFIIILYKIITIEKGEILSKKFIVFFSIFIILFALNNSISQILYKTIALQYFWGIALLSYFYYKCFTKEKFAPLLSFITGLIIGLYNEAIFLVCFSVIFSYIIYQVIQHRTINKNVYFFLIPFILGGIAMFSAPGSYHITETRLDDTPFQLLIKNFWKYIFMVFTEFELSPLFILAILSVIKFENNKLKKIMTILCLFLVWLTIYPICFQFTRRVALIYMFFYFSIISYYIYNYPSKINDFLTKNYKIFCFAGLVIVGLFLYIFGKYHYYEIARFNKMQYYRNIGQENISLEPIKFAGIQLIKVEGIHKDPNEYANTVFAEAYGFKKVTASKS